MDIAKLFKQRDKLHRELDERVSLGCGSSVERHYAMKIHENEQAILTALSFTCPHCGKSLHDQRVIDYAI